MKKESFAFRIDINNTITKALFITEGFRPVCRSPSRLASDRPRELIQTYPKLAESAPQLAREIRERVILVAFGCNDLDLALLQLAPASLTVLPLTD